MRVRVCTRFYIVLLEGATTADQYCGMESPACWSSSFWPFTIWNSSQSSTALPSTTTNTATIHTVTTRVRIYTFLFLSAIETISINPLCTTTTLPPYTTTAVTTTILVIITMATSETTTTISTITTTEYIPDVDIIYPKDMEQQCLQPVKVVKAAIILTLMTLYLYRMINLFVEMNSHLQKETLKIRNVHRR